MIPGSDLYIHNVVETSFHECWEATQDESRQYERKGKGGRTTVNRECQAPFWHHRTSSSGLGWCFPAKPP